MFRTVGLGEVESVSYKRYDLRPVAQLVRARP